MIIVVLRVTRSKLPIQLAVVVLVVVMNQHIVIVIKFHLVRWLVVMETIVKENGFIYRVLDIKTHQRVNGIVMIV